MKHQVSKVWIENASICVSTIDGLQANYAFSMWPRLAKATEELRANFYLSYSGIHWLEIDEDLSFEGMFAHAGLIERTAEEDAVYYVPPVPYEVPESSTGMVAEAPTE